MVLWFDWADLLVRELIELILVSVKPHNLSPLAIVSALWFAVVVVALLVALVLVVFFLHRSFRYAPHSCTYTAFLVLQVVAGILCFFGTNFPYLFLKFGIELLVCNGDTCGYDVFEDVLRKVQTSAIVALAISFFLFQYVFAIYDPELEPELPRSDSESDFESGLVQTQSGGRGRAESKSTDPVLQFLPAFLNINIMYVGIDLYSHTTAHYFDYRLNVTPFVLAGLYCLLTVWGLGAKATYRRISDGENDTALATGILSLLLGPMLVTYLLVDSKNPLSAAFDCDVPGVCPKVESSAIRLACGVLVGFTLLVHHICVCFVNFCRGRRQNSED